MYRVILVDDEPLMLEDLQQIIDWQTAGFKIAASLQSGQELISYLKRFDADLIITDIVMPGMSGLEVCEYVMEKSSIPVILLSAHSDFEYAKKAVRIKAFEYLTKPVEPEELLDTLKRASAYIEAQSVQLKNRIRGKLNELINEGEHVDSIIDDLNKILRREGLSGGRVFVVAVIQAKSIIKSAAMENEFLETTCFVTPIGNMKYLCLFILSGQKFADGLLQRLQVVSRQTDSRIGVSGVYRSIKEIAAAIEQADAMLQSMFADENAGVFAYERHDINKIILRIKGFKGKNEIREFILQIPELIKKYNLNSSEIYKICVALMEKLAPKNTGAGEAEDYGYLLQSFKTADDIVKYLLNFTHDANKNENISTRKIVKNMIEYINDNYDKKIYIGEFAQKYFLHPKYLSAQFKNEVGKPFIEYLIEIRLRKAEELLKDDELPINKISEMVGYDDYFHFSKLFKKYKGVSPSRYRAELKNESGRNG